MTTAMDLNYIFKNDRIRILGEYNAPLIPVVDVAAEIGDPNYHRYVTTVALPGDTRMHTVADRLGREQHVHVFTVNGVYRYLFRSNQPKAVEFQEYVTSILEELRTKGIAEFEGRITQLEHHKRVQANVVKFLQDQVSSMTDGMKILEKKADLLTEKTRLLARNANTPYKREDGEDSGHLAERYIDHFVYRFKFYAPKKRSRTCNNVWRLPEDFDINAVDRAIIDDINSKAAVLYRVKDEEKRNDDMWLYVRKQFDRFLVPHEKAHDDKDCDD